eukprot:CAMPEP_0203966066 /NCGR_PEP_ID=MMETSP0359-20131031/95405_1 /ASSEMBLY_ACC=CAM_ASM_000338 /TAXON_ID=268821 /ORGANISM="Scrippsiella Hangoei, Strain SHTV-5" /LENGTH=59 /DNA_ID=CAMNT_0050903287 /DNA_START=53 /DNA_END=229 /DNA_ORIENTATION=-
MTIARAIGYGRIPPCLRLPAIHAWQTNIGDRRVPPMPQTASKPLLTRSADVNIMGAHTN